MSNIFMSEDHCKALTRAAPEIRHRFRFSELLSELEARGEITSSNIQGIKACKTDNDKGDELLDILKKGSADTFDVFFACLESKNVNQPHIVECIKQYLDDIVPPAISASENRREKGSGSILRGKKDGMTTRCFAGDLHSDTKSLIIFNNKFDGARCRQCETEAEPSVTCEKCFTCVCEKCEKQVLDFDGSHVFRQYIPIRICRRHRRESCDLTTWCVTCEDVCCYRCVQATEHKDHITSPLPIHGTGPSTISTKLEMRLDEVAASFTYPAAYYGVERTLRAAKQRQQKYVTQFTPDVSHSLQQTIDQLELLIKPCKNALDARNDFIQLLKCILESHDPVMLAAACSQLPAYNPFLYQDILTESHVTLPYMAENPLLKQVQHTTHSILPTFSEVTLVAELHQDYSLHGLALNLQEGVIYTRSEEENKAIQIYDSEADIGDWKSGHLTASECFTGEELQGLAFDCKRDCLVIPGKTGIIILSTDGDLINHHDINGQVIHGVSYSRIHDTYIISKATGFNFKHQQIIIFDPGKEKFKHLKAFDTENDIAVPIRVHCNNDNIFWNGHRPFALVSDRSQHRILFLDIDGSTLGSYGTMGNDIGQFKSLTGICTDPVGNIYICDSGNKRVVQMSHSSGSLEYTIILSKEQLKDTHPIDILVHPYSGVLYVVTSLGLMVFRYV